jgi:hypothetical protein
MVQRITKTCLKPDIGCFVLFDGGFSGLVVLNFSAQTAMELYESYMLNMGMPKANWRWPTRPTKSATSWANS